MRKKKVTDFQQSVYDILIKVPSGKVTTYKEIGNALGKDGNIYRAIGQALNKNPFAPIVPCHRVVASDGSLGGFADGSAAKVALLEKEGIAVSEGKIVDFEKKVWRF